MRLFSRRRLIRAVVIWAVLATVTAVLTVRERRRMQASATSPAATAEPVVVDGDALMADVQRLASPEFEGRRTATQGSRNAQRFIVDRFRSIGASPVFDAYTRSFSFTHRSIKGLVSPFRPYKTEYRNAVNIGATIRGRSQPQRFIALTAHYDALGLRDGQLYPGADDNASGVAVMLGAARVFSSQPLGRSLLLLALDAEELGLRGADDFVRHPPVGLDMVDVVVNLDMVGRGEANVLVVAGTAKYPQLERPVRDAANGRTISVQFGHDRPFYAAGLVDDWTHSSDQGPFHDAGVPFLYFGVEDHPDFHRPTDTADRIPAPFIEEAGNLVISVLRRLDGVADLRSPDRGR